MINFTWGISNLLWGIKDYTDQVCLRTKSESQANILGFCGSVGCGYRDLKISVKIYIL